MAILTEINKEIEHYIQQRYPITYANKGKEKLQIPAVTPQRIQPLMWKKTKIGLSINPSYHYTFRSIINILSAAELLGIYDFRIMSSWEVMELEEEEDDNQKFNYQNPIINNSEIKKQNI
ncbi:hypothetical protein G9A89_020969 [Geosiphon pyriformis]|nr:hypothetical protein G9A89_020969 [Geosiphon pyriformis]